jgi:DsbC/DsbD-like thiol-disulfide interchange protein
MFKRPTIHKNSGPLSCPPFCSDWHRNFCGWIMLASISISSILFSRIDGSAESQSPITFSPIQVELVSDQLTVQPGQAFTVGIHQTIQSGYHTYWRNAGTVGLPTAIQWNLPKGFEASEILWPTPELSKMADYSVWGYHDEALLLTQITPPKDFPIGNPIELVGEGSWMCCGTQCHPGFKTLSIRLNSSDTATPNPDWRSQFQSVRDEQPRAFDQWAVQAMRKGNHYTLQLTTNHPIASPHSSQPRFYGHHRQVSSAKPQRIEKLETGYILHLQHEEFSGEDKKTLSGIVVSDTPWDPKHPRSPLLINTALTIQEEPEAP